MLLLRGSAKKALDAAATATQRSASEAIISSGTEEEEAGAGAGSGIASKYAVAWALTCQKMIYQKGLARRSAENREDQWQCEIEIELEYILAEIHKQMTIPLLQKC
jgi:hypothetical protein